jgi:hypothetical protein
VEECSIVAAGGVQIGNQPDQAVTVDVAKAGLEIAPSRSCLSLAGDLPSACFTPFLLRGSPGRIHPGPQIGPFHLPPVTRESTMRWAPLLEPSERLAS